MGFARVAETVPVIDASAELQDRVLRVFTARAERVGIRRVRMEDLASDLRVSKRTIYAAYPSKEALVRAFVDTWMARIRDQVSYRRSTQDSPIDQLRRWAKHWASGNGQISDVLWDDIRTEYPQIYAEFRIAEREQLQDTTDAMRKLMREDVHPEVAIAIFAAIRRMVRDERVRARLGMGMEEVLVKALEIWARGSYKAPEGPEPPRTT